MRFYEMVLSKEPKTVGQAIEMGTALEQPFTTRECQRHMKWAWTSASGCLEVNGVRFENGSAEKPAEPVKEPKAEKPKKPKVAAKAEEPVAVAKAAKAKVAVKKSKKVGLKRRPFDTAHHSRWCAERRVNPGPSQPEIGVAMKHPLTPFMLANNLVDHLLTSPRVILDAGRSIWT
jgi:hypothetical protein